jgi:hypothetical protein
MKLINATVLLLFLLASTSPCLSQVASAQNSQTINITRANFDRHVRLWLGTERGPTKS